MSFNPIKLLKISEQAKIQFPGWIKSIQNAVLDLDFFELIQNISEAVSREEEERIVKSEITKLKVAFNQTDPQKSKKRECLIRMIYCHMLGYDVPFGHIQALNMTQDNNMLNKRTGYLALSLCLPEKHEMLIMAVNSMIKGLNSSNYVEVCASLTALSTLGDAETAPAFLPHILVILAQSSKPMVRKRCVAALHRLYSKSPDILSQLQDGLRVSLCDRDPAVMAASIAIFLDASRVETSRNAIIDLVPSFVSILKQVAEGRLPVHYIYHGMPHPWLQISLLKLLANLGANNKSASEHMYQVVMFAMNQSKRVKNNAGFSVLYESIKTLTMIVPHDDILAAASEGISQLLKGRHNNLRYIGIKALTAIVKVNSKTVTSHQLDVIECLESNDETLKRKSLDLLYRMTNSKNIVPICAKLIDHLVQTQDNYLKDELVARISDLAEKFSPNDYWYIETMIRLLYIEGTRVGAQATNNLILLIANGSGKENNEEEDIRIRRCAVQLCWQCLRSSENQKELDPNCSVLPYLLVRVISWVLSEYSFLEIANDSSNNDNNIPRITMEGVINEMCDYLEMEYDGETKFWLLSALCKLSSQIDKLLPQVSLVSRKYLQSRSALTQQKAWELLEMFKHKEIVQESCPVDSFCEVIDLDHLAKHLGTYAKKQIVDGASAAYIPYQKRKTTPLVDLPKISEKEKEKELNFEYPKPPSALQQQMILHAQPTGSVILQPQNTGVAQPVSPTNTGSNTPPHTGHELMVQSTNSPPPLDNQPMIPKPNKVVWTRKGFVGSTPAPQPQLTGQPTGSQPLPQSPQHKQPPPQQQQNSPNNQNNQEKKQIDPNKEKMARELFGALSPENEERQSVSNRIKATMTGTKGLKQHQTSLSEELITLSLNNNQSSQNNNSNSQTLIEIESTPIIVNNNNNNSTAQSLMMELSPKTSLLDDDDNNNNQIVISSPPPFSTSTFSLASQISPGNSFNITNLNLTPIYSKYIDKSKNNIHTILHSDSNIVVSIIKVIVDNQLCILQLVSNNQSSKPLNNVLNMINGDDHLNLNYDGDSIVIISQDNLLIEQLSPKLTALEIIKVNLKKVGHGITINSTIHFELDQTQQKPISLTIPIDISDFLINNPLNIEQFQALWAQFTQERELTINPVLQHQNPKQVVDFFLQGLNLEVSVMDKEYVYASCKLVSNVNNNSNQLNIASNNNNSTTVLMRIDLTGQIAISIKANDKNFADVVARHCYKIHNLCMNSFKGKE